jgi:hypothetical protein
LATYKSIKKIQNPSKFLATTGTYHKNLAIFLENLGLFLFCEKSFVLVEIIFFGSKFGRNSPVEETLELSLTT